MSFSDLVEALANDCIAVSDDGTERSALHINGVSGESECLLHKCVVHAFALNVFCKA
jgi:hypothetical protein